jgi:phosphatidylglycerol lysyltransferase
VGPAGPCEELAWDFLERCDGMAVSPVFYQVAPDNLSLYIDLGLTLTKLGEEARIPLRTFSLEGGARADLRQTHRRAVRDGAQFAVIARMDVPAIMSELRGVSDSWLAKKQAGGERW